MIPLLTTNPKGLKGVLRDRCAPMFVRALSTTPVDGWMMGKQNALYTHNGVVLGHKKEETSDFCYEHKV